MDALITTPYILKGYDMDNYETTADLMENFRSEFAIEATEYDYYNKPLDSSGWTQYDYDYADNNPFWLCEE